MCGTDFLLSFFWMIGRTGLLQIETYHTCICGSFKPLKIVIHVRTVVSLLFFAQFL